VDFAVIWASSALDEAEAAVRYAADNYSPAVAEDLRAALFAATDVLARFPEIGAIYEEDTSGRTREILCRQYRIFYRPRAETRRVDVILVWHSARREPRLPD
jgi:plasmid stabilization system protein ParE